MEQEVQGLSTIRKTHPGSLDLSGQSRYGKVGVISLCHTASLYAANLTQKSKPGKLKVQTDWP